MSYNKYIIFFFHSIVSLILQNSSTKGVAQSKTGGWCAKVSGENGGVHRTDKNIIPTLADLFTGKSWNTTTLK